MACCGHDYYPTADCGEWWTACGQEWSAIWSGETERGGGARERLPRHGRNLRASSAIYEKNALREP